MLDSFVSAYFFPKTLRAHFTTLRLSSVKKNSGHFEITIRSNYPIQFRVMYMNTLSYVIPLMFLVFFSWSVKASFSTTVCRLGPALSGCNLACNCRLSTFSYKRRIDIYDRIENLRTRGKCCLNSHIRFCDNIRIISCRLFIP